MGNRQYAISNSQGATVNAAIEFKIFCGNRDLDGSLLQGVAFDEWVNYSEHAKVWYSSNNNVLPVLQREIKKERPNHLFITGIYSWQYNFKPLLFCDGVKKIISVRGMLHPGALSQKGLKKKIYLGLWKFLGLHKKNVFHATDEEERKYIQQVFGNSAKVCVAANFPRVLPEQPVIKKEVGHLKLVSVALISAMKNILLVLQSLIDLDRQAGNTIIEYNIYGPVKDKNYWKECEVLIRKSPPNITVNYHGDIAPDKIVDALADNHVFILPSKSENFGHAIYEALAAGRPVVTSNNTPWNKLEAAKAGMNVSLADTKELIHAIELFAGMNEEELEEWSRGARKYAGGAVDVGAIKKQYEEMFGLEGNKQ